MMLYRLMKVGLLEDEFESFIRMQKNELLYKVPQDKVTAMLVAINRGDFIDNYGLTEEDYRFLCMQMHVQSKKDNLIFGDEKARGIDYWIQERNNPAASTHITIPITQHKQSQALPASTFSFGKQESFADVMTKRRVFRSASPIMSRRPRNNGFTRKCIKSPNQSVRPETVVQKQQSHVPSQLFEEEEDKNSLSSNTLKIREITPLKSPISNIFYESPSGWMTPTSSVRYPRSRTPKQKEKHIKEMVFGGGSRRMTPSKVRILSPERDDFFIVNKQLTCTPNKHSHNKDQELESTGCGEQEEPPGRNDVKITHWYVDNIF